MVKYEPTKLTKQIEKITNYEIRKQNLIDEITRLENSEDFSNEFDLFIKNNRLNIYDLNLKSKNVNEIIVSLNASDKNKETIGDYIISNHKLL